MKNKLVLSYIFNLLDMVIMLCCYNNDAYMGMYRLPRPWLGEDLPFICAKVILVAILLICVWNEWKNQRCTETWFKIKVWALLLVYIFLVIYDILIMGGAI